MRDFLERDDEGGRGGRVLVAENVEPSKDVYVYIYIPDGDSGLSGEDETFE